MFERFNAAGRSLCKRFNASVRTVAHVADNLMPRCGALCEVTITDALNLASYKKLSRDTLHVHLHLKSSPFFPFSSVNVSSSASESFKVRVIVFPLIDPA